LKRFRTLFCKVKLLKAVLKRKNRHSPTKGMPVFLLAVDLGKISDKKFATIVLIILTYRVILINYRF